MRALTAAALAAAFLLGACGGSGDKLAKLPGGRAAGPGFEFQLSGAWRALRDLRELSRVVTGSAAKQVPGLDVSAGIVFGGAWTDTSNTKARRTANVVIEPVTSDSSLEDVARSSVSLLGRTAGGRITTRRTNLGGEPAVAYRRRSKQRGRSIDTLGLIAHRGDHAYTVTLQGRSPGSGLESLGHKVSGGWKWVPPSGRSAARLERLRELDGSGYHVTLPPGWRGTRGKAAQQAGLQGVDSFWSGHLGNGYSTNVNVGATAAPVKNLDTAAKAIAQLERSTARQSGGRFKVASLRRGRDLRLGGSRAALLEVGSSVAGSPLQQREVIALHASRLYRVTLSAQAGREPKDERAFRAALKTWRWQD